MPQSDPILLMVMLETLKLLNVSSQSQCLVDQVRSHIQLNLSSGEPNLETIANDLNLSSCILSRRLKLDGITFTQLIDQTRYELACNYIKQKI